MNGLHKALANIRQGAEARRAGDEFEKQIEQSFDPYFNAGIAWLDFLPVPMVPCAGQKHPISRQPLYVPSGQSPFDVFGWHAVSGTFIGAELKTTKPQQSLSIQLPELTAAKGGGFTMKSRSGSGLKYHQLEALRNVAVSHGIARLVWDNGGQVGVLREEGIVNAWSGAWTAFQIEQTGKTRPKQGLKSIRWEHFEVVDYTDLMLPDGTGTQPFIDWLRHELIR